ncbi:MAG: YbjQ family protein [Gemmatimonadales bacterium]|nr:MAG: YbjQ family protein [Gemmatimonadales bacterium]
MVVTTTSEITGTRVRRTLGLVRGNTIRTKHFGKDILAWLRYLVGGEIPEYTKMMAQSREQALDRMIEEAEKLGANAVLCTRFQTSKIMSGASEILCYGTAVVLERDSGGAGEAE